MGSFTLARRWACHRLAFCWFLMALSAYAAPVSAATPTAEEIDAKARWFNDHFLQTNAGPLFSFQYGSKAASEFFESTGRKASVRRLADDRTERAMEWVDDATGLTVRCVAVTYDDHPVVEWTVSFKNAGEATTPLLQNIQGLDLTLEESTSYFLHGLKGDSCTADSYEPFRVELGPDVARTFAPPPYSGKSSDGPAGWPYHNVQYRGGGMIVAIGWPGQWQSSFTREGSGGLRITAGQQTTHLVLQPGEEIRTPLIALLFYLGDDVVRAQNLWRSWYLDHVIPKVDGKPQGPLRQVQVNGDDQSYVQSFLDAGVKVDLCWRDAGGANTWYPSDKGPFASAASNPNDRWLNTGTWEIDRSKFPQGFKPFSDWCHDNGMKFLLWFEPERVGAPETFLGQHPEWLLPRTPMTVGDILNLGNPDARAWLVNHIDSMIKSEGIDWYREDMNGNGPLTAWRAADAENRQGITENLYVQGHLAFWDELKRRNPRLSIDSCASGGRRNDLETMRRAVPLLRSDFQFPDSQVGVFEGNQCHTYGLSSWLPFQGTGCYRYGTYELRSFYLPLFGMGGLTPENRDAQVKAYQESARIAPHMLMGDYYPLTPYSLSGDVWIGWQFHRPELGEGVVQVFRREGAQTPSIRLQLQGLDPALNYEVTNFDGGSANHTGRQLMERGLEVVLEPRTAAIFTYEATTEPSDED